MRLLGLLLVGPMTFLAMFGALFVGAVYLVLGGLVGLFFFWSLFWLFIWVFVGDPDAPRYFGLALLLGMIPAAALSLLTGLLGDGGRMAVRPRARNVESAPANPEAPPPPVSFPRRPVRRLGR